MNRPYTCPAQEYIGRASAYTIGLVIPSLDPLVKQMMGLPDKYASIGIISSRTGTVTQALAIDDACKAVGCELLNTCGMPLVSVKEAAGACGEKSVRNTYTPEVCRKKTD